MKKLFLLFFILPIILSAQTFSPAKKDVRFSGQWTYQTSGDTTVQMVYPVYQLTTSEISVDSAATATDTTDIGCVAQIIGIMSSSTFDSSAVTIASCLDGGSSLYDIWVSNAIFSFKMDSNAITWLSTPIYARKIKLNFTAQNSSATLTLIHR